MRGSQCITMVMTTKAVRQTSKKYMKEYILYHTWMLCCLLQQPLPKRLPNQRSQRSTESDVTKADDVGYSPSFLGDLCRKFGLAILLMEEIQTTTWNGAETLWIMGFSHHPWWLTGFWNPSTLYEEPSGF